MTAYKLEFPRPSLNNASPVWDPHQIHFVTDWKGAKKGLLCCQPVSECSRETDLLTALLKDLGLTLISLSDSCKHWRPLILSKIFMIQAKIPWSMSLHTHL